MRYSRRFMLLMIATALVLSSAGPSGAEEAKPDQDSQAADLANLPFVSQPPLSAGAGYYVESPDIGPDWKRRLAFTVLLPAGQKR